MIVNPKNLILKWLSPVASLGMSDA